MFSGGTGSYNDPYLIATVEDLDNIRNINTRNKWFEQVADIDFDGMSWEPIGNSDYAFRGIYHGQNYKIKSLRINKPTSLYVGLFGRIAGASITDCHLEVGDIQGYQFVGSLVGYADGSSFLADIRRCTSTNINIRGHNSVGGLIGKCVGDVSLYRCSYIQGVLNIDDYGHIDESMPFSVGGLIGSMEESSLNVRECCSLYNHEDRYNVIRLYGKGGEGVGGLIGSISNSSTFSIIDSFSYTDFPQQEPSISFAGGFVGSATGNLVTFRNCYSLSRSLEFLDNSRGFVQSQTLTTLVMNNCYYYTENLLDDLYAVFKTTGELKQQSTFENWDFDTIWGINPAINDGYPFLRWMQPQPSDSNVYVKTSPTTIKKAIKMCIIDTPTTVKEIKKLNVITDTGLK